MLSLVLGEDGRLDAIWIAEALGLGWVIGRWLPDLWLCGGLLAVSIDVVLLVTRIEQDDITLWPIWLAGLALWGAAVILGGYVGRKRYLRRLRE